MPSLTDRGEENVLSKPEQLFIDEKYEESYELFLSIIKEKRAPAAEIYLELSA